MAYIDDVVSTLADNIASLLAPYLPNLPPDFPNASPFAGQIPSTLTAPGNLLQYNFMTRLENKQATVLIHDGKVERDMPFLNTNDHLPTVNNGDGTYSTVTEIARRQKEIIIEVCSYDQPSRRAITELLNGWIGDFIRLTEKDGTTTVHRYTRTTKVEAEQKDSVYINNIFLMSDFTITQSYLSYPVLYPELTINIEDPAANIDAVLQPPQY